MKAWLWMHLAIALLLNACSGYTYVPMLRDVSEEVISGDYWYQKFTLYNPADITLDCQISRTGWKIDLKSPAELAQVWRKYCQATPEHDSPSSDT